MKIGAGTVAAKRFGAAELIDPRPYAVGKLAETFRIYPQIGNLLPAMGYGEEQIRDLKATIERTECDSVIIATPIDLTRVIQINKPNTRVEYSLQEIGRPDMDDVLKAFIEKNVPAVSVG
jgi:predicted GTPase